MSIWLHCFIVPLPLPPDHEKLLFTLPYPTLSQRLCKIFRARVKYLNYGKVFCCKFNLFS